MRRREPRPVRISDLRASGPEDIHGINDVYRVWHQVPSDIQDAILTIVQATVKKPDRITARTIEIKRLYLELYDDPEHFPKQESIIREIMKRVGISARSTVMKHLKKIRENDPLFPSASGPKTTVENSD